MKSDDRWSFLGLLGLVLWIFREPVFQGAALYKRDIHLVWYPQVESFVRAVAAGSWPVWDPFPAGGQPLLADPSAQIAYPFTWLNLVLRPWIYYTLFACVHVLFSGIGFYRLGRRWGMSRAGGFLAAGLWILSGPFLSLVDLWHHLTSAAWIPWVLLAADAAFETPTLRNAAAWGAAMAFQILGGSADICAMTGLTVAADALTCHVRWHEPLGRANRSLLRAAAVASGLAVGLSAVLWLPALEVASRSARRGLPVEVRTHWSLHPLQAVETLVPVLWGRLPLKPSVAAAMFESREPFLASIYLGAASLALVGAGVVVSPSARKRTLAILAAVLLLLALGRNSPFYGWLTTAIPPLRILRYPVKAMTMVAACWALLAGFGFDVWRGAEEPGRRRWLLAVVAPAAVLASVGLAGSWMARYAAGLWGPHLLRAGPAPPEGLLAGMAFRLGVTATIGVAASLIGLSRLRQRAPRPLLSVALGILAIGDLAALHRNIEPVAQRTLFTQRPEVLDHLKDVEHPRVYVYDYTLPGKGPRYLKGDVLPALARSPKGWGLEEASALAMQMSLTPLTAGRWGLDGSFEIDYRGLYPRDLVQLTLLLRHVEGTPQHLRLLQMGGVTHVVALHVEGFEDLTPAAELPGLFAYPIRVFRVPEPLPRTYVVGGVRVADGPPAFAALIDPTFDPRREVVLPAGQARPAPVSRPGSSHILDRKPDRVVLEANMSEEAYVVLLDSYDPGWQVTVDSRRGKLLEANVAFRAVLVPKGRHTLEFVYRPPSVTAGLLLSATSLGAALIVAAAPPRRGAGSPGVAAT